MSTATVARNERPGDPPRDASTWRAVIVTGAVLAVAALLYVLGVARLPAGPASTGVPWWAFIGAFALTDMAVVHLHLRRSEQAFSLSEVPLVIGLFFVAPHLLFVARVIAAAGALYGLRPRRVVKVAFNVGVAAVETASAILIFRALVGTAAPDSDLARLSAVVAAVAGGLAGMVLVSLVTWAQEADLRLAMWQRIVATAIVSFTANASLGLVAVTLLQTDVTTIWYLVVVVAIVFFAYRGYSTVYRRNEDLQLLYDFTQGVGGSLHVDTVGARLLAQACAMVRAQRAELILEDPHDPGGPLRWRLTSDGTVERVAETARGRELRCNLAQDGSLVLPRNSRNDVHRAYLDEIGAKDALLVRLPPEGDVSGVVLVADRTGDVFTFSGDDLRLLQTLANHASVALANGRLVDRLTEQVAAREHEALHDTLTGLPNRTLFKQELARAIEPAGAKAAVLLMDLNGFKDINDTLGHSAGDLLLRDIAGRLERALDSTGGLVARLGGDEFAVLLPGIGGELAAKTVAHEVLAVVEQHTTIDGLRVDVNASIGISLCPLHGTEPTTLLRRADVAMYGAKESSTRIQLYSPERDYHSPQRLALVGELRSTVERGELRVVYQPKADLRTGRVVGVEALARWNHPDRGFVPPEEFIAVAERSGVIRELTMHVLRTALKQCRAWRLAGLPLQVAVNLSARSLRADFPAQVAQVLAETGVAAGALTLEITESSIMTDPEHVGQVLDELSAMGVSLSIDDFGTGYSSLTHLKRLPFDEIKIDKSFVVGMGHDEDDLAIVRSTVDLGRNLGLRVVAEGIEDRDTWTTLTTLGCDMAQGYYLSTPVTPTEFDLWLETRIEAEAATGRRSTPRMDDPRTGHRPTDIVLPPETPRD